MVGQEILGHTDSDLLLHVEIFSHKLHKSHRGTYVRDIEHACQAMSDFVLNQKELNRVSKLGMTDPLVRDMIGYVYNGRQTDMLKTLLIFALLTIVCRYQ